MEHQKFVVFKYSDGSIVSSVNIVKFKNISLVYDKELYYGDEKGKVVFKTEKYSIEQNFTTADKELFLSLNDGEIVVYPPILSWRIDDSEYCSRPLDKAEWYKEYSNSAILYIDCPLSKESKVELCNDFVERRNTNEYYFGRKLYSSIELQQVAECVLVIIVDNVFYKIMDIYCKEGFVSKPIVVESLEKNVYWMPEYYIGDNDAKLFLSLKNNEDDIYYLSLDLKTGMTLVADVPDGKYQLIIYSETRGFFRKKNTIYESFVILGNEKNIRFQNKQIEIGRVMIFNSMDSLSIRKLHIDGINYLGNVENFDIYSGNIYLINKNDRRKNYIDYLYNDKHERIQINPLRIQMKTSRTAYIGYGLDLEDEDFEYDDEFTLQSDGKISINKTDFDGRKNKSIDYYEIEVKDNV